MKKYFALIFIFSVLIHSCEKQVTNGELSFSKTNGVFIACEGNFLYGNASLWFYDIKNQKVYSDVYFTRNNAPLGDVAQSLEMNGSNLFIVVNNSGKVVVIDKNSMEHRGAVKELVSPRAIHFVNSKKAYISDMLARKITVIDPGTLGKTGFIRVSDGSLTGTGHSTESFVQVGNFVFVTCWVSDNKVLVIDTSSDAVVDSVTVPYQPNKMLVDVHSKIWIQTDGEYFSTTGDPEKPALVKLDPVTRKVEKIFRLNQSGAWFTDIRLTPKKDSVLFMAGDLYKMSVTSDQLPDKSFISSAGKAYYSFGVDPVSGDLYMGDALDYTRAGVVYRFSPKGVPLDTFTVGVCPGDFLFKY